MAKSLLSTALRAAKAIERERARQSRANTREYNATIKKIEREAKAKERRLKQIEIEDGRKRKIHEKELKVAHIESQMAEVTSMNAQISDTFSELEELLKATIDVDDYVDLELLRKPEELTPFDKPELETRLEQPINPDLPLEPEYQDPPKPKGFFGKKKKIELATQEAKALYEIQKTNWLKDVVAIQSQFKISIAEHIKAEEGRVLELAREKKRFSRELKEHNEYIDQFISNLAYGDVNAVQEYISIVVENSIYPDHFKVTHDFLFDPKFAELKMKVSVPNPEDFPSIKAFKYVKTVDEIRETQLSKKEYKDRYCSSVYQVAIRSLHEIFEADRRDIIKTISLEVGTNASDPATGKSGFIQFVGASAEKEIFMEFDLSSVVPLATLKHLGAAISKDPINLVTVDLAGIRKA